MPPSSQGMPVLEEQSADPALSGYAFKSLLSFKPAFKSLINPFIKHLLAPAVSQALLGALGMEDERDTVPALKLLTVRCKKPLLPKPLLMQWG